MHRSVCVARWCCDNPKSLIAPATRGGSETRLCISVSVTFSVILQQFPQDAQHMVHINRQVPYCAASYAQRMKSVIIGIRPCVYIDVLVFYLRSTQK